MANEPSPFIPPTFTPSPGLAQQPLIPEPPIEPANLGWGGRPQHSGAFPIYPSSPFVAPGFQPPLGAATPTTNPNRLPPTLGTEFVGYPGGMPPNMYMGASPWTAPPQHSPWQGMPRPQGQPFLQPPNTGGPFPGYHTPFTPQYGALPPNMYGGYPGGPSPGWGLMNTPAAVTPAGPAFLNFPAAWNAAPWAAQQAQQNERPNLPASRSSAHVGDRVDPFMAGTGYGPVLDPFEAQILNVSSRVNPLLEPIADAAPDRPHLKWNMLFRSNDCHLSTDQSHVSWSKGRDAPATFPRFTKITIVSETFPWTVPIEASDPAVGVTCGDVIDQLGNHFHRLTSKEDYDMLDKKRQVIISQVYRQNRSREPGVPGGTLGEGVRRLDFLEKNIIFGGIYRDDQRVFNLLGTRPSCHYVLKCSKQYALTAQEAQEHEDRQREFEEGRRKKEAAARRRATVEDASDSDE